MIICLTFCHKDEELIQKLARWMATLGGLKTHDIVLNSNTIAKESGLSEKVEQILIEYVRILSHFVVRDTDIKQWPHPQNHSFIRFCKEFIQNDPSKAFLWMESDAVPLTSSWANDIEDEYKASGKVFMGDRVSIKEVPEHMSGIGVYRQIDTFAPSYVTSHQFAWDVVAAPEILPRAHITRLIQHDWKPEPFKMQDDLKRIRSGAVVYHQCKDGSLIDILSSNRTITPISKTVVITEPNISTAQATKPLTISEQIRFHAEALEKIIDGKQSLSIAVVNELRVRKLVPQAKRRK